MCVRFPALQGTRGCAAIAFWNGDVAPDLDYGNRKGVFACFEKPDTNRSSVAWGTISALAGPRGEWWAAKLASPAWELYRKKGLVADEPPAPDTPQQEGRVSYHLRTGKHNLTPYDWIRYMDFADRHGWRGSPAAR